MKKSRSFVPAGTEVYESGWLKSKLTEKYGDHIFFAEVDGRRNVVCFRNMASYIISDKWHADRKAEINDEASRIVKAAGKLIKEQIREKRYTTDAYPSVNEILDPAKARQWLPPLLQDFLNVVIGDSVKSTAIGHSIVQSVKPKGTIAPFMFGIGISLAHKLASSWLLTLLNRFGFCISYDEVSRFKQSSASCEYDDLPRCFPHSFSHLAGDNVDHNSCTIDGLNTFHGMGIISMTTPCSPNMELACDTGNEACDFQVPRLVRRKVCDVVRNLRVPLVTYTFPAQSPLSLLKFIPLLHLQQPCVLTSIIRSRCCMALW